ncbi:hypothetical protein [Anaerotignum lactatifermentans]|uniref:hypothetical protein n=1 Tax=Anaerotignum lactatifermentans TaxID=160404 RepID=UPI00266B527D|nr:hypothetical protein [Anaerotignum lactatifermentans]
MRRINLKEARSQLEELKRLQGEKDTIFNVVARVESSGQISATLYRGLPKSGKVIAKTFPSLCDLLEFPGITDETNLLLDDMALAPDMYLPVAPILWFCPPEEVRAFIRFNQEGNQNKWLKRYIDLIQSLQKEGFPFPDIPVLNDLMENHSRFSLEELVERYQDRRWFVPYEPNR